MAVFNDQRDNQRPQFDAPLVPGDDELRRITGIGADEEGAMDREAYNGAAGDIGQRSAVSATGLADAEAGGPGRLSRALNSEEAIQAKAAAKKYAKKEAESFLKLQLKKYAARYALAAIAPAVGFIVLVILIAGVISGPGEFLHFAALLQKFHFTVDETLVGHRGGLLIKYAHTANNPIERNLSYVGNKFADRYENRLKAVGITPEYENRRIRRLAIDPKTSQGKQALNRLASQGVDTAALSPDADGKVRVDLDAGEGKNVASRRRAIKGMVSTLDINGPAAAVITRTLRIRSGVPFYSLSGIARDADENYRQYRDRVNQEKTDRIKNGTDSTVRRSAAGEIKDDKGNPITDGDDISGSQEANDIIDGAADTSISVEERSAKLKAKLTSGVGATGYLATICAIKAIGDLSALIRQENIVQPLIRTSMEISSTASQIQAGTTSGVNSDELGVYKDALFDEKTNTSWRQARSIEANLGEAPVGPDMPDAAKPGLGKPVFFTTLDSIIGIIPGGSTFCKAVNSTLGGWTLAGLGVALTATGPISALLSAASETGQYLLAGPVIEGIVRWVSGEQIAGAAAGALLGNYADYGALLAANETAISHGGIPRTPEEDSQLTNEENVVTQAAAREKSPFARYADLSDTDSLAAKFLYESPLMTDQGTIFATILRLPVKAMGLTIGALGNSLPKAHAATRYDYGFPEFGFTLSELDDDRYQDPYANAAIVEPQLEALNAKYGMPCFGTTVDPHTYKINSALKGGKSYADIPDLCKDRSNVELTRYRFYLVDQTTAKAMLCYDFDDDDSCAEAGDASSLTSSTPSTDVPATGSAIVGDPYTDTLGIPCDSRTKEVGTADGYVDGKLFRVRLCSVPNLPSNGQADNPGGEFSTPGADGHAIVNSRVSGAWFSLVEAAKADGVSLSITSSFRSMPHQESLFADNPDPKFVARPGYSSHQAGVAIDFDNMHVKGGDTCETRARSASAGWDWLYNNAQKFGFKQYSREAWHWDALPDSTRCGPTS